MATNKKMENQSKNCRSEFLSDQFEGLSIWAAFSRGYVFNKDKTISAEDKSKLKNKIKKLFSEYSQKYQKRILPVIHTQNISDFAERITKEYKDILDGGQFRIGTAQKAFNLYLKYLWCAGWLRCPPPHCPFDSVIYAELARVNKESMKSIPPWTRLTKIEDYEKLVKNAEGAKSSGESLPEWECRVWLEWKKKQE